MLTDLIYRLGFVDAVPMIRNAPILRPAFGIEAHASKRASKLAMSRCER